MTLTSIAQELDALTAEALALESRVGLGSTPDGSADAHADEVRALLLRLDALADEVSYYEGAAAGTRFESVEAAG